MAVLVKTFCCCISLRTAVKIIGIFGVGISIYSFYQESHSIKVYKQLEENADELSQDLPFGKKHFLAIIRLGYVNIAFKVISLLVNLMLLGSIASCDNCKRLAYPWLVWSTFEFFFNFGVILFFVLVWNGFAVFLLIKGIVWLLSIYLIVVVYSYIEDLRAHPIRPGNSGQQEPRCGISMAKFKSNSHCPSRTSAGFSSSSNGWKWTTSTWGGGPVGGCGGHSAGGSGGGDCGGGGCGGGD